MKTGTKIGLWIAGITVVGVGGYLVWKKAKKARETKAGEVTAQQVGEKYKPTTTTAGKPRTAQTFYVAPEDPKANPFPDKLSLTMFQNWVLFNKKDKSILGSDVADGKWGGNTAAAWAKYKDEWNKQ